MTCVLNLPRLHHKPVYHLLSWTCEYTYTFRWISSLHAIGTIGDTAVLIWFYLGVEATSIFAKHFLRSLPRTQTSNVSRFIMIHKLSCSDSRNLKKHHTICVVPHGCNWRVISLNSPKHMASSLESYMAGGRRDVCCACQCYSDPWTSNKSQMSSIHIYLSRLMGTVSRPSSSKW
jgi:hypothetical protein